MSAHELLEDTHSKRQNYNVQAMRKAIEKSFADAFDGKAPYDWQVNVTEALLLGLDCVIIAGTGAGKTMPFGMPLLMDQLKKKIVIIISPLNELEREQVSLFPYVRCQITPLSLGFEIPKAWSHCIGCQR